MNFVYLVYPGSRNMRSKRIPDADEIERIGAELFCKYNGENIVSEFKNSN